jgi:hypothetical protein
MIHFKDKNKGSFPDHNRDVMRKAGKREQKEKLKNRTRRANFLSI